MTQEETAKAAAVYHSDLSRTKMEGPDKTSDNIMKQTGDKKDNFSVMVLQYMPLSSRQVINL